MSVNDLTEQIIGSAIEVHRALGPGLLESVYEECFALELSLRGMRYERQRRIPVQYKGHPVAADLKLDFLVNDRVVVELKSIERLLPVHSAQVLTYLRLIDREVGLLINFNVPILRDGIRRVANGAPNLRVSVPPR